jgi:hypothetical protein
MKHNLETQKNILRVHEPWQHPMPSIRTSHEFSSFDNICFRISNAWPRASIRLDVALRPAQRTAPISLNPPLRLTMHMLSQKGIPNFQATTPPSPHDLQLVSVGLISVECCYLSLLRLDPATGIPSPPAVGSNNSRHRRCTCISR